MLRCLFYEISQGINIVPGASSISSFYGRFRCDFYSIFPFRALSTPRRSYFNVFLQHSVWFWLDFRFPPRATQFRVMSLFAYAPLLYLTIFSIAFNIAGDDHLGSIIWTWINWRITTAAWKQMMNRILPSKRRPFLVPFSCVSRHAGRSLCVE